MKSTTVRLSDVIREQRMDAEFHLEVSRLAIEIDSIRRKNTAAELLTALTVMSREDLQVVSVLRWGSSVRDVYAIVKRYPFACMALIHDNELKYAVIRAKQRIKVEKKYLAELELLEKFTTEMK